MQQSHLFIGTLKIYITSEGSFSKAGPERIWTIVSSPISLPGIKNTENVFAINVKGDSMEPTIKNQSIIICRQGSELRDGEVGAFLVNGESFVKRIKVTKNFFALLSDNPNYQPIYVYPQDEFKVIGKVLKVINDVR